MYYLNNMNKIIVFIKNNKYIAIIALTMLVVFIIIKGKGVETQFEPTPVLTTATYKNLIPGRSSKEEVLTSLGTAINAKIDGGKENYEYKSSNPNFNTEVVIINDKLSYIKIVYTIKDNIKHEDFISQYGEPEKILYGPDYPSGYVMNSYPSRGVSFLYHQNSRKVREVWYFIPTALEMFIKDFAPAYSEKIKPIQ